VNNVVTVRRGDCPCPGRPHSEEQITLSPVLTLPIAAAALTAMQNSAGTVSSQQGAIVGAYLPAAITSWTFTDERRSPVEITQENLDRLVPWGSGGLELVEACDELYSDELMRPLLARIQRLLPPTQTDEPTSPNPDSGSAPLEPQQPSSPNGSAGKVFVAPGQ